MASTFTTLGIEKMATGENAGTWGDKTNTNLDIVNTAISGYVEQAVTSGGTTALSITDGAATSTAQNAVIKLTGTISGNSIVTVPDSVEKVYIVTNGTSGAYTVQFKTASGTGITFGVSEKTTRLVYSDGTNIVDAGFSGALDIEGRELVLDADGDTTITADTDDQIDIKIAGADDFQFTANTFTAQSGSSIVVPDGGLTFGSTAITSTAAELNLLDGVSGLVQADLTKLAALDSTAAELNIVDGGTSATSTTVADADRVVLNDNGTMVQVAVTDLAAYFDDEITAMPNLVTTAATTVGALNSGSITSGFGTIDTGSSTITTTGLISGGSLDIDNVLINGTTIGHTDDTDLLTVADGLLTVAGEVSMTTLDIGGTNVTATAAEINLIDGGTARGTTAVADGDGLLVNDAGTMRMTNVTTLKTYFQSGAGVAADDITAGDAAVTIGNGSTSADVIIDSGDDVVIDAAGGNIEFKDAGTTQLTLDMDGTGGAQVIQLRVDTDDLIFKQFDGTTVLTLDDDTTVKVATDLTVGDDLSLITDSAVLKFGADGDTTLTHTDGTGLTLNSTNKLCFNDASQFIQGASATVLDIAATDEIELTATLIDVVGTLAVSGTATLAGILSMSDGSAGAPSITNTGDTNTGLLFSAADKMQFTSGGTAQFTMENGGIIPVTDNDIDLGTASLEFKNVYVDGTVFTDALGFGTTVMTLPTADGNANQILITDGSGALSFTDNSGGTSWVAVKTSNYTASAGEGVFANTTSASFTVTLPASPSIGDEVSIKDYAGTFDTNALTIGRNSQPIEGVAADLTVSVERAGLTLAYSDSTQGWLLKDK